MGFKRIWTAVANTPLSAVMRFRCQNRFQDLKDTDPNIICNTCYCIQKGVNLSLRYDRPKQFRSAKLSWFQVKTEFVAAVYSRFCFLIVRLKEKISSLPNLLHLGVHMAMWRDFYKTRKTVFRFSGFNSSLEVFEWQEQCINEEEMKMKKTEEVKCLFYFTNRIGYQ